MSSPSSANHSTVSGLNNGKFANFTEMDATLFEPYYSFQ